MSSSSLKAPTVIMKTLGDEYPTPLQTAVSGPSGAAIRLGLRATTLEARMRKLGITRPR